VGGKGRRLRFAMVHWGKGGENMKGSEKLRVSCKNGTGLGSGGIKGEVRVFQDRGRGKGWNGRKNDFWQRMEETEGKGSFL